MIENSMCYDITSDEFDIEQEPLLEVRHRTSKEKIQSKIIIGNITIYNIKKFNWFRRLMFKNRCNRWLICTNVKNVIVSLYHQ